MRRPLLVGAVLCVRPLLGFPTQGHSMNVISAIVAQLSRKIHPIFGNEH